MSGQKVVFRDYPLILWLLGAIALFVGIWLIDEIAGRLVFIGLGIAAVGFMAVLTVTVDHTNRTLYLKYRSLFRRSIKMFSIVDVCGVNVVCDNDEGNFRIELLLRSGQRVPLRSAYSPGKWLHERKARRLRAELGIIDDLATFLKL